MLLNPCMRTQSPQLKLPPPSGNSRRLTLTKLSRNGTETLKASGLLSAIWQSTPVSVILRRGSLRNTAQAMYQSICTSTLPARTLIMKCPGRRFRDVSPSSSKRTVFSPKPSKTHLSTLTLLLSVRLLPSVAL